MPFNNIERSVLSMSLLSSNSRGLCTELTFRKDSTLPSFNYVMPSAAYVADNSLFGVTGPIVGRRMRFQAARAIGNLQFNNFLADYRRYDPVIFNTLTFATRLYTLQSVGRDEEL